MSAFLFMLALVSSLLSGYYGSIVGFGVAVALWISFVLAARKEAATKDIWKYGIPLGLIVLAAFGGLSWPAIRNYLGSLGLVVGAGIFFGLDRGILILSGKALKKIVDRK